MAKNNFGKILAGVTIIGAGVALGLAIFNKFDTIKRELESDEFEDEDVYEDEDELAETDYVTINPAAQPDNDTDTQEESSEETADTNSNA